MNNERMVMGDAPDQEPKSRNLLRPIVFGVVLFLIILFIAIFMLKNDDKTESQIVEGTEQSEQFDGTQLSEDNSTSSSTENITIPNSTDIEEEQEKPVKIEEPKNTLTQVSSDTNTYEAKAGDCLWIIAGNPQIYGDSFKWTLIYEANKNRISDPDIIYPGQQLLIPKN